MNAGKLPHLAAHGKGPSFIGLAAQGLGSPLPDLALHPPLAGRLGRLGGAALFLHHAGRPDDLGQPLQGRFPILFQTTELLGLDDQYAVFGQALIAQGQEFGLIRLRERGVANIKAQMHRIGDLVDVLAARTLGADGGQFNLGSIDGQVGGNGDGWHDFLSTLCLLPS
jgi:hypothetical protein